MTCNRRNTSLGPYLTPTSREYCLMQKKVADEYDVGLFLFFFFLNIVQIWPLLVKPRRVLHVKECLLLVGMPKHFFAQPMYVGFH